MNQLSSGCKWGALSVDNPSFLTSISPLGALLQELMVSSTETDEKDGTGTQLAYSET